MTTYTVYQRGEPIKSESSGKVIGYKRGKRYYVTSPEGKRTTINVSSNLGGKGEPVVYSSSTGEILGGVQESYTDRLNREKLARAEALAEARRQELIKKEGERLVQLRAEQQAKRDRELAVQQYRQQNPAVYGRQDDKASALASRSQASYTEGTVQSFFKSVGEQSGSLLARVGQVGGEQIKRTVYDRPVSESEVSEGKFFDVDKQKRQVSQLGATVFPDVSGTGLSRSPQKVVVGFVAQEGLFTPVAKAVSSVYRGGKNWLFKQPSASALAKTETEFINLYKQEAIKPVGVPKAKPKQSVFQLGKAGKQRLTPQRLQLRSARRKVSKPREQRKLGTGFQKSGREQKQIQKDLTYPSGKYSYKNYRVNVGGKKLRPFELPKKSESKIFYKKTIDTRTGKGQRERLTNVKIETETGDKTGSFTGSFTYDVPKDYVEYRSRVNPYQTPLLKSERQKVSKVVIEGKAGERLQKQLSQDLKAQRVQQKEFAKERTKYIEAVQEDVKSWIGSQKESRKVSKPYSVSKPNVKILDKKVESGSSVLVQRQKSKPVIKSEPSLRVGTVAEVGERQLLGESRYATKFFKPQSSRTSFKGDKGLSAEFERVVEPVVVPEVEVARASDVSFKSGQVFDSDVSFKSKFRSGQIFDSENVFDNVVDSSVKSDVVVDSGVKFDSVIKSEQKYDSIYKIGSKSVRRPIDSPLPKKTPVSVRRVVPREHVPREPSLNRKIRFGRIVRPPRSIPKPKTVRPPYLAFKRLKVPEGSKIEGEGYRVFVKKFGVFRQASDKLLTRESALRLGRFKTGTSASATFKLTKDRGVVEKYSGATYSGANFYRKSRDVFVEKRGKRIKSTGELQEITYKGLSVKRARNKRRRFL